MRALRAALSVAMCLAGPLAAQSALAICEFQTSGDWGPVSVFTGNTDCISLDGSEEIRIPAGVTVRIVADVVQTALPGALVLVMDGGNLTARAAERSGGPGRLTVAFTPKGLQCEIGSQCVFEGVYRQMGVPTPSPRDSLAAARWLGAGEVVPCPGWNSGEGAWVPDCAGLLTSPGDVAGSSYEVGFVYPGGAPPSQPFLAETIGAFDIGDVLCFSDPEPATPAAPVDDGFCYEITLAQADAGGGIVKIDIRQTNPARPRDTTYPFSLREVRQGSLGAGLESGARNVIVDPGVLAGTRPRERVGMWLRFADAAGTPRAESYKIVRTWNAPLAGQAPAECPGGPATCDVLEIYDPRGFQAPQQSGDALWIDYGHAPGEPFFVMAPVVLTEADGVQEPNKLFSLTFRGDLRLGAALIDDTSGVALAETNVLRFQDVWLRDVTGGGSGNGLAIAAWLLEGTLFERLSITGGNASAIGADRIHSIGLSSLPSSLVFRNLAIRHGGDDGITHSDAAELDIERYRAEWITPVAQSANLIGQNNPAGPLSGAGRDLFCQDCNRGGPVVRSQPAIDFDIDGVVRWGSSGGFDSENSTGLVVRDLLQVGGDGRLPVRVDGFAVALESGAGTLVGGSHQEVRDGIVRDTSTTWKTLIDAMADGVLENVAAVDVSTTRACTPSECSVLRLAQTPAVGMEVRNFSVAFSPSYTTRFGVGVDAGPTGAGVDLDGLLVAGMTASSGAGWGIAGSASATATLFSGTTSGPLLYDNVFDAQYPAGLPPSAVLGVAPGFVDPAAGRFDTIPGSPADLSGTGILRGVDAPGLTTYRWIHAITRTVPEVMADDADGDGVPEDPAATVCTGGAASGCSDNCPLVFNPDQADADSDGIGDLCDIACADGEDDDLDLRVDFPADPGCSSASDDSERSPSLPCDDGLDNDNDGFTDHAADTTGDGISEPPGDSACFSPLASPENPACSDGINNDPTQDLLIDWDGGAWAGVPLAERTAPDPQCGGKPWKAKESSGGCGLGFELILLAPLLSRVRRLSAPSRSS